LLSLLIIDGDIVGKVGYMNVTLRNGYGLRNEKKTMRVKDEI